MPNALEQWYWDVPVVTRVYLTILVAAAVASHLELVQPLRVTFHWELVRTEGQWWRLFASFFFLGRLSIGLAFHTFFMLHYCRMLEEGSFRSRTIDFVWFLLLGAIAIVVSAAALSPRASFPLLSLPLSFMLAYLWARRNATTRVNFLGMFTFHAPFLPFVLLAFSVVLNARWPSGDLLGLAVGHIYYYIQDVLPTIKGSSGVRLLDVPRPIAAAWNAVAAAIDIT